MEKQLQVQQYLFYYPLALMMVSLCVATLLGARFMRPFIFIITTLSILFFLINIYIFNYPGGSDFSIFLKAGVDVLKGVNPYADGAMVSPPTALPLFALMASFPTNVSLFIWTTINICIALVLIQLSQRVLQIQVRGEDFNVVPRTSLNLLVATLVLSLPIYWGLTLGQLALFVTVCLFVALYAQAKNKPVLAGFALALATIKPQTMLPFLLLFLRKSDRLTWIVFICISCVLCLVSGQLDTLPFRIQNALSNISQLSMPGAANDYSFDAPYFHTIVGLDYALYCLGFRDRVVIRITQLAILGLLGGILTVGIWRKNLPRSAAFALVSIYAFIFLYHRFHDAAILALPLFYAWSKALSSNRPRNSLYTFAFITLLPIFFIHPKFVQVAVDTISSKVSWLEWLLKGLFLPYATWCSLIAMGLLYIALRQEVKSVKLGNKEL